MAFAFIQSNSIVTSTGVTCAFTSNVTAASMLVVHLGGSQANLAVVVVTDSQSNSYTQVASWTQGNPSYGYSMWIAFGAAAGATTVTATGLSSTSSIAVSEYTVVASYSWFTGLIGGSPGSITPFVNGNSTLIVMGINDFHSAPTWVGVNLTVREQTNGALADLVCADGVFASITTSTSAAITGGFILDQGAFLAISVAPSGVATVNVIAPTINQYIQEV